MQSYGQVYYHYRTSTNAPYRFDIPKGEDLNKLVEDMRKAHPRHHRIVIKIYSNPYEDWDMKGERLLWCVTWEGNAYNHCAWYCM